MHSGRESDIIIPNCVFYGENYEFTVDRAALETALPPGRKGACGSELGKI